MNVEELMALDRELTDEEFAFLEQELLAATRQLHDMLHDLATEARVKDARLADKLEVESEIMLASVEAAAALPLKPGKRNPAP